MSRIVVDPAELAALAALWRNSSYDAAGIAHETRYRADTVRYALAAAGHPVEADRLAATVERAGRILLSAATALDDGALLLAAIGERGAAADAIAEAFGGGEHALLTQLREGPAPGAPA